MTVFRPVAIVLLVAACGGRVSVVESDDDGEANATPAPPEPSAPDDAVGGEPDEPDPIALEWPCAESPGQFCDEENHPADDDCASCLCRCCDFTEAACQADTECLLYVNCVVACEGGPPCAEACVLPCRTGTEPACYLADCHNWVCGHACE